MNVKIFFLIKGNKYVGTGIETNISLWQRLEMKILRGAAESKKLPPLSFDISSGKVGKNSLRAPILVSQV
jgi:hypothetical protein